MGTPTLQQLRDTIWYRLLKVVYVGGACVVACAIPVAAVTSNPPRTFVDPLRTDIMCVAAPVDETPPLRKRQRHTRTGEIRYVVSHDDGNTWARDAEADAVMRAGLVDATPEKLAAWTALWVAGEHTATCQFLSAQPPGTRVLSRRTLAETSIDFDATVLDSPCPDVDSRLSTRLQAVCGDSAVGGSVIVVPARITESRWAAIAGWTAAGLAVLWLLFELGRRLFYYVVLGTFRPRLGAISSDAARTFSHAPG